MCQYSKAGLIHSVAPVEQCGYTVEHTRHRDSRVQHSEYTAYITVSTVENSRFHSIICWATVDTQAEKILSWVGQTGIAQILRLENQVIHSIYNVIHSISNENHSNPMVIHKPLYSYPHPYTHPYHAHTYTCQRSGAQYIYTVDTPQITYQRSGA